MSGSAIEPTIIFMGTPQFAVPSLKALAEGPYSLHIVTQPDRSAGRGNKPARSPVKLIADELGLPVRQPESLKDPDFRAWVSGLRPTLTVLVAYGEYVAPALLDLPARGSINLHPSLLPRWRGSTPIQAPILAGDSETGVTIIQMDRGLDTGPILARLSTPLGPEETYTQLAERLAVMGAGLLAQTVPLWLAARIDPTAQDDSKATVTHVLTKEDGLIDWTLSAEVIFRRIRALNPWPGTFTFWGDRMLKIIWARPAETYDEPARPGQVAAVGSGKSRRLLVGAGSGALELLEVQLPGKPVTTAQALLSGYSGLVGSVLGPRP